MFACWPGILKFNKRKRRTPPILEINEGDGSVLVEKVLHILQREMFCNGDLGIKRHVSWNQRDDFEIEPGRTESELNAAKSDGKEIKFQNVS